jgi:hypothetical protein
MTSIAATYGYLRRLGASRWYALKVAITGRW